jgi:hypothetical protein
LVFVPRPILEEDTASGGAHVMLLAQGFGPC